MKSDTKLLTAYKYKQTQIKIKYLFFFITLLILFISCNARTPVITSIDPKFGRMGEIITLSGKNFGAERNESFVTIAGISPTNSSYYSWQDNLIVLRVPELGESGLVYVRVKGKKSNGVLFSNSASVPHPVDGEELGLEPKITSVNPQTGAPGTLITITGNNFGISRENLSNTNAGVFFSWDYESGAFNPYAVREPEFIEVSETEMGYEYWSAREIRVRLPDGAVSGNLEVRTPHGKSRTVFFDVSGKPGNKIIKDKRSYTITYSVDIRVTEASRPNTLYLWIPKPVVSPSQRNVILVSRNIEPFMEDHKGVSLYKLDNLGSGTNHSVNLSYRVEVYSVESGVKPLSINKQEITALSKTYTQNTSLIPSDNQKIKAAVNSIVGKEQNPYLKAKAIYDWIINNMSISISTVSANLLDVLENKQGDPYSAALLYTAMTRATGIPCIPIAGVLINQNGQTFRHYWAEFWIDGFGWLPVDPAMGTGAIHLTDGANTQSNEETATGERDLANFYFGNVDNQRIMFSRGELVLSQIESRGRLVSRPQSYSLQNVWEESEGGLESYSSLWGDITIGGIYSH